MIQQFLTKLTPQERKIAYAAVVFVLVAVLDRLFLGPAAAQLKSLDQNITIEESSIKKDLHFLSYKERILKESEALKPYLVQKPMTEEEIIASFLKKIEILSSQSSITLVKVNPSASEQKKGYKEYYANLECRGTLPNIISFMHLVDSSPELLKTQKMTMGGKKAASEDITATMTIAKIIVDPPKARDSLTATEPENSSRTVEMPADKKEEPALTDSQIEPALLNEKSGNNPSEGKITDVQFAPAQ